MKINLIICLAILIVAFLAAAVPTRAGEFLHRGHCLTTDHYNSWGGGDGWCAAYYDPAWGMPLALVVPPTARRQSNYAWGVGGTRVNQIGAEYEAEFPGPESVYNRRAYLPAPPQPSDTQQFGVYYVRGPRP